MASNLDRSLDEILATRPRANRRGGKATTATVTGGIRKRSSRVAAQKANVSIVNNTSTKAKGVPTGPSGKVVSSKIIVSNLVRPPILHPYDATSNSFLTAFRCLGADD